MSSTPTRSTSSSPEPIFTPAARRDSSDRLSKTRIASMLLYDERETSDLRRMLLSESQRADHNERRAREAIQRFRAIDEARVAAQQDAARANEELRLYKLQLEYAQREIHKAQDILETLETQRYDAETSAAKARNVARKLREESLVDLAREEGRRLGLQEGLTRGRRLGFDHARSPPPDEREDDVVSSPRTRTPAVVEPHLEPIGEMLSFPRSPPALPPNPEVLSQPQPALPPPHELQPVVRDISSPSHHPENIIPPDGFIPHAGNDSTIRLPPPHEMVPPIAPSSPILERPASMDSEPLMVRNRDVRHDFVPLEPESPGSTTISQFDLVSEPNGSASRQSRRKRRSLSVIPESVSSDNTPAGGSRSISMDHGSRPPSSMGVPHGSPLASASISMSPGFVRASVADGSRDPHHYVYHRPSFASSSSSSGHVMDKTPVHSVRSLGRMSSFSSVPDITVQPPSRSQSQTPQATTSQATLYPHHGGNFLSAEDAAHRPVSPTISAAVLDPPSSPVVSRDNHAGPAGSPGQHFIPLSGGLPRGFVPMVVSSPSQAPVSLYSPSSAPANGTAMSPRMSAHGDPRALYGVPSSDGSSSRHASNSSAHIPLSPLYTADPSVVVPPASLFSSPSDPMLRQSESNSVRQNESMARPSGSNGVRANEAMSRTSGSKSRAKSSRVYNGSSSETEENRSITSSLAGSNDTLSTPPPPSHKRSKAKKSKRPTYDAAPITSGQEYPLSPLMGGGGTLPSTGPSGSSESQMRSGPAGMTPAARHKNLRH
ncbi:hypothetical protein BC826DRAFT_981717 [Russula brevipes]|nr:hypothetical protein BC826DRAFT_981717 [Russula brevipes]